MQGIGHLPHNPQPVVYMTWNDEARVLLPAENRSELDTPFLFVGFCLDVGLGRNGVYWLGIRV